MKWPLLITVLVFLFVAPPLRALATNYVWVPNRGANNALKFATTDNGNIAPTVTLSSTRFNAPVNTFIDSSGNLWITENTGSELDEFSSAHINACGASCTLNTPDNGASGLSGSNMPANWQPQQLWVYPSNGDVWVSGFNNHSFDKWTSAHALAGGNVAADLHVSDGAADLVGMVGDSSENVYISEWNSASVAKYNSSGTRLWTISGTSTTLSNPGSVGLDASNNFWVQDVGKVLEFASNACSSGTCNVAPIATITLTNASGIVFDAAGSNKFITQGTTTNALNSYNASNVLLTTVSGSNTTFNNPNIPGFLAGATPTPTPTPTATPTPTQTPTPTATPTPSAGFAHRQCTENLAYCF